MHCLKGFFLWAHNVSISGLLLNQIAKDLARQFSKTDFKGANGCADGGKEIKFIVKQAMLMKPLLVPWKVTHYLLYYKITVLHVSIIVTKQCLYYIDGISCSKGEKAVGAKDMAVLCCSNADDIHKMLLFVIEKLKNRRCFRGVKTFPIKYEVKLNAWMTANLFQN